jgi:hypothetical protein
MIREIRTSKPLSVTEFIVEIKVLKTNFERGTWGER